MLQPQNGYVLFIVSKTINCPSFNIPLIDLAAVCLDPDCCYYLDDFNLCYLPLVSPSGNTKLPAITVPRRELAKPATSSQARLRFFQWLGEQAKSLGPCLQLYFTGTVPNFIEEIIDDGILPVATVIEPANNSLRSLDLAIELAKTIHHHQDYYNQQVISF